MDAISSADPVSSLLAMQADATANKLSLIMIQQQARQEQAVADMVGSVAATAAAPPGQGTRIDRSV